MTAHPYRAPLRPRQPPISAGERWLFRAIVLVCVIGWALAFAAKVGEWW